MNRTLQCLPPDLLRYLFLQEFSKNIFVFICALDTFVFLSSSIGNIVILAALRKSHCVHPPSKALFSSLALSDLAVGVVVVPLHFGLMLATVIKDPSLYCMLLSPTTVIAFVMASVSTLTTTAIAVDRYLAFRLGLRYRQFVKVNRVVVVLVMEWLIGIAFAGSWIIDRNASHVMGAIANCLCAATNFFCYWKIFFGLRQRRTIQIQEQNQSGPAQLKCFNLLVYRKSAKNMFTIYCIILFCYIPYFLALVLQFAFGVNSSTFLILSISYTIILLNSSLNPIVYFWRIREIRQQVLEIFSNIYVEWTS